MLSAFLDCIILLQNYAKSRLVVPQTAVFLQITLRKRLRNNEGVDS